MWKLGTWGSLVLGLRVSWGSFSPLTFPYTGCASLFPHPPGCLGWEAQPAVARGPVVASGPAGTRCPQVQDVVKCQMGVCRADESEDSPDSCKNGQLQILVSEGA